MAMLGDRKLSRDHIKCAPASITFRASKPSFAANAIRPRARWLCDVGYNRLLAAGNPRAELVAAFVAPLIPGKPLLLRRSGASVGDAEKQDPTIKSLVGKFVSKGVRLNFNHSFEFGHLSLQLNPAQGRCYAGE